MLHKLRVALTQRQL